MAATLLALAGCAGARPSGSGPTRPELISSAQNAEWVAARFGDVTADRVAPADRDAYFAFLTDRRVRQAWLTKHPAPQPDLGSGSDAGSRLSSVDVDALSGLLDLAKLVGREDPALAASTRRALLHEAYAFADTYARIAERSAKSRALVSEASGRSAWGRAEAAWIAWVNRALPAMVPSERSELAKTVLVRSKSEAGAFPGLDRVALGFSMADEWAKAGHPDDPRTGETSEVTIHEVLCVVPSRPRRSTPRCSQGWYDALRADPRALREGLDARHDAKIEELVLTHLGGRTPSGPAGLRALVGDWPRWERAFDLALEAANRDGSFSDLKGPLVWEARAAWQAARGPQRGRVMERLARIDYPHFSRDGVRFVDWEHFEEWFGGRAAAEDLAGFLDADPKAWAMVGVIWPALGASFSRSEVIVPRLKEHLGNPDDRDDEHSLGGIAGRLCEEGRTAEMADIARVLRPLAAANPGTRFVGLAKAFADVARCERGTRRAPARRT
jgi:hypothetical protein